MATTGAVAVLTGCTGAGETPGPEDSSEERNCSLPDADTDLKTLLPPASDGRSRSVERRSDVVLSDFGDAVEGVRATYDDNDDDVLDDPFVEIIRFREEQVDAGSEAASNAIQLHKGHQSKTATMELKQRLNSIAVDDGRAGTGALLGRIGFVAGAPDRSGAKELLARSPALSTECRKANKVSSPAAENNDPSATSESATSEK